MRKQYKECFLAYKQLLDVIDIVETILNPLALNHKKARICYFCADILFFQGKYKQGIGIAL